MSGSHDGFAARLERARQGDGASAGALLTPHVACLTALARAGIGRRVRGKVDATDVVQEALLDAHRQLARFRGATDRELAAWLRRILAGQLALAPRRHLGARGRDARRERPIAEGEHVAADDSGAAAGAQRRERAALLAAAVDALPPDYRAAVALRHREGLPFAEVARRLGKTEAAAEKLWLRALARLRATLGRTLGRTLGDD